MPTTRELLHQGRKDELWQICCGFLDLNLEQFMGIQRRLLLEQVELLKKSELGKKVMRGANPKTVEEFRQLVPLTTYSDYCPELLERRENVLPARTNRWVRTSGRSGEYSAKWVPWSEDFCSEFVKVAGSIPILAFSEGRGDVSKVKEHLKILFTMGPATFGSGAIADMVDQAVGFDILPSRGAAEMSFEDRIKAGFKEALYKGIDGFGGLPFILVAVGEQFKQRSSRMDIGALLAHPMALLRITKGLVKSKLAGRPLMPKDIWKIKGILGGGTDIAVFKDKIEELWGRYPLELYGGTEGGIYALQAWNYEGLTFVPNLNFLEFIPEEEHFKWQLDHSYQPKTILLDEVGAGQNYEVVLTNLHGGALVRYRVGDMIRITALRDDKLGINLPQMSFERRADDLIDLSYMRLTERVIWKAIEKSGIPYQDWVARKEVDQIARLRLYLELKDGYVAGEEDVATIIYDNIKKLNDGFIHEDLETLERVIGFKPIEVTLLPKGAFAKYINQRRAEGSDLAHLKPPHMNPSDKILSLLETKRKVAVEARQAAVEAATTAKR